MEIMKNLMKLGYRVVPELQPYQKYEIIVEPWDFRFNKRRQGRVKRTGFLFSSSEVNRKGDSPYQRKLKEVQIKLIEHLTNKQKSAA